MLHTKSWRDVTRGKPLGLSGCDAHARDKGSFYSTFAYNKRRSSVLYGKINRKIVLAVMNCYVLCYRRADEDHYRPKVLRETVEPTHLKAVHPSS